MATPQGRRTALYRLYNQHDALLYVGITHNPKRRFTQHAADKHWWPEVTRTSLEWYDTRRNAEAAEVAAITANAPHYNRGHSANATVTVVIPESQAVGFDLLRHQYGLSREDMLWSLLDRELAARGLLGDPPCYHTMLGWPDGIAVSTRCQHAPATTAPAASSPDRH